MGSLTAILFFLAGAALTIMTFTQWPAVAVIGVVVELVALRMVMARCAPRVGTALQRWTSAEDPRPGRGPTS